MSRIGRMPVVVPGGVDVTINGRQVHVKGPKGELSLEVPAPIEVVQAVGPSPLLRGAAGANDRERRLRRRL